MKGLCVATLDASSGSLGPGGRDSHHPIELADSDEREELVVGSFHVQLQLGVLIGHPQALDRQGADVHQLALPIGLLSQTLGPQLPVPVGHLAQPRGVGHHHAGGPA